MIESREDLTVKERFVGFILRLPHVAFLLGTMLVVALAAGIPRLQASFNHTAFYTESDPLLVEFNAFERQFGNDDALVIVLHSPSGIFDLDSSTLLQKLTEGMWLIPDVIRVDSVANYSWVHASEEGIEVEPLIPDDTPLTQEILAERKHIALNHEVLPDYLISRDGRTALVYARIRPGFDSPPDPAVIMEKTGELLASLQGGDHEFYVTGSPAVDFGFKDVSHKDSSTLVPIVVFMAVIFLLFLFRSIGGVMLPFAVILASTISALGIGGWAGIEISTVTIALPQVLIAIATADAVHILSGFYRARRRGLEKLHAVRHSLLRNLTPTILTSVSTAAGFFSFASSQLKPVFGIGVLSGSGTIVAWIASYLLMGPLLVWAPSWVRIRGSPADLDRPIPWVMRYARALRLHRRWVIGVFVVFSAGAIALATTNRVNADPYKYFPEEYFLRKAHDFILDHLAGVASFEMRVNAGEEDGVKDPAFLRKVEAFEGRLTQLDGISKSVSLVEIFKQTNRSLNGDRPEAYVLPHTRELLGQEFLLYTMSLPQGIDVNDRITVKNDALRVTSISSVTESKPWLELAAEIEGTGRELGLDVTVTGKNLLYQGMNDYVVRSLIRSLFIAVILLSLILMVALRSVRLGLLAMIPNLIPLMVGGAALKLVGHTIDLATVLVFSVCLGIAVDDTIHVLANYRQQRDDGETPEGAVAMTLTHTGPALVITTLVLVAAFGSLGFATFLPNVFFGILSAIALLAALVTDLTLLPVMLMLESP